MKISDPFPGIDTNTLSKHRHLLKEGDRVTVCDGSHAGRSGKLLAINAHKGHVVRLDSGHEVEYKDFELEPEGFSCSGRKISLANARTFDPAELAKAGYDPIPDAAISPSSTARRETRILSAWDRELAKRDDPLPVDSFEEPSRSHANGFADGLLRAIEQGTISASDRALLEGEVNAIRKSGGRHSHAALEALCVKYSGVSDRLEKRERPGLRVGMKVRGINAGELGKVGTIRAIDGPLVRVTFDDGSGESTTVLNSTMETLIPVEG